MLVPYPRPISDLASTQRWQWAMMMKKKTMVLSFTERANSERRRQRLLLRRSKMPRRRENIRLLLLQLDVVVQLQLGRPLLLLSVNRRQMLYRRRMHQKGSENRRQKTMRWLAKELDGGCTERHVLLMGAPNTLREEEC